MKKRPANERFANIARQLTGQKDVWEFYCDCPKPELKLGPVELLDMSATYRERERLFGKRKSNSS